MTVWRPTRLREAEIARLDTLSRERALTAREAEHLDQLIKSQRLYARRLHAMYARALRHVAELEDAARRNAVPLERKHA